MGASAALLATLAVLAALLCSCRLWGESLAVRAYHHQVVRTRYDPRKAPVVETTRALEPGELAAAKRLAALCCALSPNALSRKYGAFDSDSSGGALYWHQMAPLLTPALWADLRAVQGAAGTAASAARRRPMHPFAFSMWNAFVLRYSGTEGSFSWHYDSEDPADCRVLFCTEATAGAGLVEFVDSAGQVQSLALGEGEGYLLRGSTTFHRVTPNRGAADARTMLGFHFSETPGKVTKNLCYFATLTGWRLAPALRVLWDQGRY